MIMHSQENDSDVEEEEEEEDEALKWIPSLDSLQGVYIGIGVLIPCINCYQVGLANMGV